MHYHPDTVTCVSNEVKTAESALSVADKPTSTKGVPFPSNSASIVNGHTLLYLAIFFILLRTTILVFGIRLRHNMEAVYSSMPLHCKDDIRLINIHPSSSAEDNLECTIEKVSLADTTLEGGKLLEAWRSRSSKNKDNSHAWYVSRQRKPNKMEAVDVQTPTVGEISRFRWGDFAALSYTWGNPKVTQPITVNNCETQITTNLFDALKALRTTCRFEDSFRLWVDALCINQEDNEERGKQVGLMKRFYTTASSVICYLGPEAEESSKAIDLVYNLASYHGKAKECESLRDRLVQTHGSHERGSWLALNMLTLRPYWERLWIVQELALGASRALLMVGQKQIDWKCFCQGIEVLHIYLWVAKDICIARDRKAIDPTDDRKWEKSSMAHRIWKDLWAISQPETLNGKTLTFDKLLEVASFSVCSDPRDRVYGLLALFPTEISTTILPDYLVDARTVFMKTAVSYISSNHDLELLRYANSWGTTGAPTWAPDWAWNGRYRDSRPGAEEHVSVRYLGEGLSPEEREPYNSSGTLNFKGVQYQDSHIRCRCVIFDEVDGIGTHPSSMSNTIIQPKNMHNRYEDAEATADALSRALCGDRTHRAESSRAILHLPTTTEEAIQALSKLGWVRFEPDVSQLYHCWSNWIACNSELLVGGRPLQTQVGREVPPDASFADYMSAFQAWLRTSIGRNFAIMSSGRFGWVPFSPHDGADNQARRGDIVAIFPGCTTPIVIREVKQGFQVIGEAYVHGMMEGEIADQIENGEYRIQNVWLC